LVRLGADLADRRHVDGRVVHDRALVLADPAAMHRALSMTGAFCVAMVPSKSFVSTITNLMALGDVGQCSSQTMHGLPRA